MHMTLATMGALAGTVATLPMTVLMKSVHISLPHAQRSEPIPPRQITMQAADAAGLKHEMPEGVRQLATMLSHFGYGAAAGAVYGRVQSRLPGSPVAKGITFGLGVWAVSYLGWLPAAGVLRPASRWPAGRNFMMIAAHVVWGAVTGIITDRLSRRETETYDPARAGRGAVA